VFFGSENPQSLTAQGSALKSQKNKKFGTLWNRTATQHNSAAGILLAVVAIFV
jgi:hypothetical protein